MSTSDSEPRRASESHRYTLQNSHVQMRHILLTTTIMTKPGGVVLVPENILELAVSPPAGPFRAELVGYSGYVISHN